MSIRTRAATDEYRENWDRMFGDKPKPESTPVLFAWSHDSPNCDNNCDCYERALAHHRSRQ